MICGGLATGRKLPFRFQNPLRILNATVIDLCLEAFDGAKFRRTKGAVCRHRHSQPPHSKERHMADQTALSENRNGDYTDGYRRLLPAEPHWTPPPTTFVCMLHARCGQYFFALILRPTGRPTYKDAMLKSVHSPAYSHVLAKLVEMRQQAGLTQRDLAQRMGREHSFVWRIEKGERRLDVVEFLWVCQALGQDAIAVYRQLVQSILATDGNTLPVGKPSSLKAAETAPGYMTKRKKPRPN